MHAHQPTTWICPASAESNKNRTKQTAVFDEDEALIGRLNRTAPVGQKGTHIFTYSVDPRHLEENVPESLGVYILVVYQHSLTTVTYGPVHKTRA